MTGTSDGISAPSRRRRPATLIEPKPLIPPHEHLAALLAQIERLASATPDEQRERVQRLHAMTDLWQAATTVERGAILKAIFVRIEIDLDDKRIVKWGIRDEFAGLLQ